MKVKRYNDKILLLSTAKSVATTLKMHTAGTRLRIRNPASVTRTNTDGWRVRIGQLGKNQLKLEIWLDHFSGYEDRKLYACFRSTARKHMTLVTKHVSRKLWPTRVVTPADTVNTKYLILSDRLTRSEFNTPILEKYRAGWTYFGIYDPTREVADQINLHFCNRAVAFFEDVARSLPRASAEDEGRDVYPQFENRKIVASHLLRERSRLLATERKILDNYTCQVCLLRFEELYGRLGSQYAEAHHLVPLNQMKDSIRTEIKDLTTVCANCHRMLHRMTGKRGDTKMLRAIVRRRVEK